MDSKLALRIDRIESTLAIQQLPTRYALALDSRDLDAWVRLFVEDVSCGRRGSGREVLRQWIAKNVSSFYRSVHSICGHTIDFVDSENATGTVYCRAEHEDSGKWVVMAIIYFDTYVRRDGAWYFLKRSEEHFFAVDALDRPGPIDFMKWETWKSRPPTLPARFLSWKPFWDSVDPEIVKKVTQAPV